MRQLHAMGFPQQKLGHALDFLVSVTTYGSRLGVVEAALPCSLKTPTHLKLLETITSRRVESLLRENVSTAKRAMLKHSNCNQMSSRVLHHDERFGNVARYPLPMLRLSQM